MRVSQSSLAQLLAQSVVELKFYRRHPKPGWADTRRALMCNNMSLLNSAPGHIALHFRPPTAAPAYSPKMHNLVCAWDIFWQDWRMVSVESCDVVTVFPVATLEEQLKFWAYFNEYLEAMTAQQKVGFMNK